MGCRPTQVLPAGCRHPTAAPAGPAARTAHRPRLAAHHHSPPPPCTPARSDRVRKEVFGGAEAQGAHRSGSEGAAAVILGYAAAAYAVYASNPGVLSGALLGLGGAWIGLTVQHCGNHGAMSTKAWVNQAMGLCDDLIGGSSLAWRYHHQVRGSGAMPPAHTRIRCRACRRHRLLLLSALPTSPPLPARPHVLHPASPDTTPDPPLPPTPTHPPGVAPHPLQ